MRRVLIEEFLKESNKALLLDVRSPSEYNHAHIPGAVSLPLFTDEERKIVGTAYKQESREAAIKIGLDYFGPRMKAIVEEVEKLLQGLQFKVQKEYPTDEQQIFNYEGKGITAEGINTPWSVLHDANNEQVSNETKEKINEPQIFLYCWRGGMRSGAVAWLLNLYGFNVTVLAGGYKTFRNYVLRSFEQPYAFKILGGYTGSGKTETLNHLKKLGERIIDLENLASHKGSAFGSINMPAQPTQEMFENLLSCELQKVNSELADITLTSNHQTQNHLWLEDESQRIGNLNLPAALWENMRTSPIYFLDIPFEERLQHITEEYSECAKDKLAESIERIKKRLGPLETKTALSYLEEGNIKECFRILLQYYDKHYLKGLHNRQHLATLLTKIECERVTTQNAFIVSQARAVQ